MIRFRNPGTDYNTQINVIKLLYKELKDLDTFGIEDMANVIANGRLMTAYGYGGSAAIELSDSEQESMNSARMNAKMYAEVFRMLGWITPYSTDSSYPVTFTILGAHIATSAEDCKSLYEQCVLGINNPTELGGKMHYDENVRFFKTALRTLIDLGGIMYKHELCLGPMSVNDTNEYEYSQMLAKIRRIRGSDYRLKKSFSELAKILGMKETPLDNCTRLPIALMKSCGWIESVNDSTLYGCSKTCIKITQHGRDIYEQINDLLDIRLADYQKFPEDCKDSIIRLGIYSMLERAGYDLTPIKQTIERDRIVCSKLLKGKNLLFSPCQTISREKTDKALGIKREIKQTVKTFIKQAGVGHKTFSAKVEELLLNVPNKADLSSLIEKEDVEFLQKVNKYAAKYNSKQIVEKLFEESKTMTQKSFYPLVATLFKILGFDCSYSRAGDNGSRWDAIIKDSRRSIPIEIKSPTEEEHISIKAVRQALENKIILLSRKTFETDRQSATFAIGYLMPNDRAEVSGLIQAFKDTYGYKIAIIDFKSLLNMAISVLVDGFGFDKYKLFEAEGLLNANIK